MRAVRTLLVVGVIAVLAPACDFVKQADYNAHVANYQGLRDALIQWSNDVNDWETKTRNVICDIVNTTKVDYTYSSATIEYCTSGTEGDGTPPEPPEFGAF
jgi:hypothetical protein